MNNNLKISVTREPTGGRVFRCRRVAVREKLLHRLLGDTTRLMLLVPEGTVSRVCITEDGGVSDG